MKTPGFRHGERQLHQTKTSEWNAVKRKESNGLKRTRTFAEKFSLVMQAIVIVILSFLLLFSVILNMKGITNRVCSYSEKSLYNNAGFSLATGFSGLLNVDDESRVVKNQASEYPSPYPDDKDTVDRNNLYNEIHPVERIFRHIAPTREVLPAGKYRFDYTTNQSTIVVKFDIRPFTLTTIDKDGHVSYRSQPVNSDLTWHYMDVTNCGRQDWKAISYYSGGVHNGLITIKSTIKIALSAIIFILCWIFIRIRPLNSLKTLVGFIARKIGKSGNSKRGDPMGQEYSSAVVDDLAGNTVDNGSEETDPIQTH